MMEEAGHRGRWSKKAPVGTILLLMCLVGTLSSLQPSTTCPPGDYTTQDGICCNKCLAGFKLSEKCNVTGHRSNCVPCPAGEFMDKVNFSPNCRLCKTCKASKREHFIAKCERERNTICECNEGYYKYSIDSETYECRKCARCGSEEKEKQRCTTEKNTVCECKENYYKVKNKCEPCESCTSECEHLCPFPVSPAKGEDHGKSFLINIITGVVVVALVLLVLGVVITHMVTKRFTQERFSSAPSQQSDDDLDSSEKTLFKTVEIPHDDLVEGMPSIYVSEQQLSKLPDCVPVEIRISDLIYTVLDLVPALQVKQLVRTLGLRETEIEQAELDHPRSCREAHYQMMRVWAEKGSRAHWGGLDGLVPQSLFLELLDKLRRMGQGRAAEELEMKYDVQ